MGPRPRRWLASWCTRGRSTSGNPRLSATDSPWRGRRRRRYGHGPGRRPCPCSTASSACGGGLGHAGPVGGGGRGGRGVGGGGGRVGGGGGGGGGGRGGGGRGARHASVMRADSACQARDILGVFVLDGPWPAPAHAGPGAGNKLGGSPVKIPQRRQSRRAPSACRHVLRSAPRPRNAATEIDPGLRVEGDQLPGFWWWSVYSVSTRPPRSPSSRPAGLARPALGIRRKALQSVGEPAGRNGKVVVCRILEVHDGSPTSQEPVIGLDLGLAEARAHRPRKSVN